MSSQPSMFFQPVVYFHPDLYHLQPLILFQPVNSQDLQHSPTKHSIHASSSSSRFHSLLRSLPLLETNNPNPKPPLSSFTLFPSLPPELRRLIWKHAASVPRTFQVSGPTQLPSLRYQRRHPSILQASHESRAEGLRYYTLCKKGRDSVVRRHQTVLGYGHLNRGAPIVYINYEVDTVYAYAIKDVYKNLFVGKQSSAPLEIGRVRSWMVGCDVTAYWGAVNRWQNGQNLPGAHWGPRENCFRLADVRIANVVVRFRSPFIDGWSAAYRYAGVEEALFRRGIEKMFFDTCGSCGEFERGLRVETDGERCLWDEPSGYDEDDEDKDEGKDLVPCWNGMRARRSEIWRMK